MNMIPTIAGVLMAMAAGATDILCVGVNEYAAHQNLACPENNASLIGELHRARGHSVALLLGKEATVEQVRTALAAKPKVVYFAGHGEKESIVLRDGRLTVKELGANGSFLLLDCCFVGSTLVRSGQTKVLAAARHEAFEKNGYGIFTKYLLKWVRAGRDLADERMIPYVRTGVTKESGGWQKPVLGYI